MAAVAAHVASFGKARCARSQDIIASGRTNSQAAADAAQAFGRVASQAKIIGLGFSARVKTQLQGKRAKAVRIHSQRSRFRLPAPTRVYRRTQISARRTGARLYPSPDKLQSKTKSYADYGHSEPISDLS